MASWVINLGGVSDTNIDYKTLLSIAIEAAKKAGPVNSGYVSVVDNDNTTHSRTFSQADLDKVAEGS